MNRIRYTLWNNFGELNGDKEGGLEDEENVEISLFRNLIHHKFSSLPFWQCCHWRRTSSILIEKHRPKVQVPEKQLSEMFLWCNQYCCTSYSS